MDKAVSEIPASYTRARVDGLVGRAARLHAALERADRVGRDGRRDGGHRGEGAPLLDRAQDEVAEFIAEVAVRPRAPGPDHH